MALSGHCVTAQRVTMCHIGHGTPSTEKTLGKQTEKCKKEMVYEEYDLYIVSGFSTSVLVWG